MTLLLMGRDKLPPGGEFNLGRLGAPVNWVTLVYCSVTTVFFFFPTAPNPTGDEMNYAIGVFGVMLVIAVSFWFVQGSRTYLNTEESNLHVIMAHAVPNDPIPEPKKEDR